MMGQMKGSGHWLFSVDILLVCLCLPVRDSKIVHRIVVPFLRRGGERERDREGEGERRYKERQKELLTFGWETYGQLGHGGYQNEDVPRLVEALTRKPGTYVNVRKERLFPLTTG
jgi:hypothetical protein